jgi:outer membrane protein assembly factor BamB
LFTCLFLSTSLFAADWPNWRGPSQNGSTDENNLPDSLTDAAWSADLPGPSGATPIISNGKIFLSSMDSAKEGAFAAMCFDAKTGKQLWRKDIATDTERLPRNNMATPSPVTDGKTVFFLYGSGHLAAFDYSGNRLWSRNIQSEYGSLSIKYGYSSSPSLHEGKLYVLVMRRPWVYRGEESDKTLDSFILAIDPQTGKNIWKIERKTDAKNESFDSYSTAVIFNHGKKAQLVTVGGDYVIAHDPASGKELWRYDYNPDGEEKWRNIPSAVPGEGLVFSTRARAGKLTAIKPGAKGTITPADIAWTFDGPTTDSPTPAYSNGNLYVLYGRQKTLTCLDAATGKVKWQGKLPGRATYYASPTVADGKVYCISEQGDAVVLAASPDEFKIISIAKFDEAPMQSTISVADRRLFVRTAKKLHCFTK